MTPVPHGGGSLQFHHGDEEGRGPGFTCVHVFRAFRASDEGHWSLLLEQRHQPCLFLVQGPSPPRPGALATPWQLIESW